MSFSVDQFMQVKCKFQLTSETESSESIHCNNERVRLCTSVDLDRNSSLIVMICSNETGNNHIVAYYIERRVQTTLISTDTSLSGNKFEGDQKLSLRSQCPPNISFSQLTANNHQQTTSPPRGFITRTKPRVITKQIYYHNYNEDIVAICLSETGNKLTLISASSTIYILPIKNILLNLHAKQLRSSQGKSMYFYDASILDCCTLDNPIAIAYWGSLETENKSTVIVASEKGELSFISVEEKKEINGTYINEPIRYLKIIRDRFSYSLLITCDSFRQYRFALEMVKQQEFGPESPQTHYNNIHKDEYNYLEKDIMPSWDRKPILIKLHSGSSLVNGGGSVAAAAIHRVLVPSSRVNSQSSLFSGLHSRDRSLPLIFYHQTNMISVVDVLGAQKCQTNNNRIQTSEPRLLRFFSSKQFYYRPQKPILVCRLTSLDPDEKITHLVLTDRFLAIATDRDRCLINSRNCCNLRNSSSSMELDPLVKEITFNNEEKILLLFKSPVSNDQDNIIDSFLLVTNRSIYSIEARQSFRDMFINLIDSHLGIKPVCYKRINSQNLLSSGLNPNDYTLVDNYTAQRKNSESNLIVSSFLCHRDEVYERINYDSRAFSILFKLELNSLYEAYGDKLLIRNEFELANRFFQMAKFDHTKTLGKYIRLGAYKKVIDHITNILSDDNEILDEKERIDLAKAAFECHLAKTIVERSKSILYKNKLKRNKLKVLMKYHDIKTSLNQDTPIKRYDLLSRRWSNSSINKIDPYQLCEHSPRCNEAKLSANTIVVGAEDDEDATMAADPIEECKIKKENTRLECEKSLINFITNLMPASLYSHVMTQLVDFGLIDLADTIARTDVRIYSLLRILLKAKDETRIVFREGRFENVAEKLILNNYRDLVRIDSSEPKFLEFITSPEVTKALVKDINLTSEYLGYKQTLIHFRKYSSAALHQFNSFKKLVISQQIDYQVENDHESDPIMFTKQQKQSIENIFLDFLNACLAESTEDSCRIWYNYINFYLNYIGTVDELESDILNIFDSKSSDCRFAITLYKAIGKDENESVKPFSSDCINTPFGSMKKLYNLSELFKKEFLMKLLEKTLELVPQSADLDSLCDCLGVDGLMSQVPLPVENVWRQILKTIQSAALSSTSTGNGGNYTFSNNVIR